MLYVLSRKLIVDKSQSVFLKNRSTLETVICAHFIFYETDNRKRFLFKLDLDFCFVLLIMLIGDILFRIYLRIRDFSYKW